MLSKPLLFLISALAFLGCLAYASPAEANCAWVLNNSCADLGPGFAEKTGSETSFCDGSATVNGETKKCCCGPNESKGCCQKTQNGTVTTANLSLEECSRITYATTMFHAGKKADNNTCVDPDKIAVSTGPSQPIVPTLQVSIPGLGNFSKITCNDASQSCPIPWMAEYIKALFKYGIIIIGLLAVIIMMIAGVIWLTAGGNSEQLGQARQMIKASLFGAVLAACSYLILFLINPNLTVLRSIDVGYLGKQDLEEVLPPQDLTSQFTDPNLPKTNLGTSSGQYKVPILYQGRYKSERMGIGPCGCGPTSLTMVLNFYGITKTVPQVAADVKSAGSWTGRTSSNPPEDNKDNCGGWKAGMDGFKSYATKNGLQTKIGSSFEDIKTLLKNGPVIASIKNTGGCAFTSNKHYVVFTGYSNGNFTVNDPNEANTVNGKHGQTMTEAEVKKGCEINAGVIAIYK